MRVRADLHLFHADGYSDNYLLSPAATSYPYSFTATPSNCAWTLNSPTDLVTSASVYSGVGSGTVTLYFAANTTSAVQVSTVTVTSGPNTYVLYGTQDPEACQYTASPPSLSPPAAGGNFPLTIQTNLSVCEYYLLPQESWIQVSNTALLTGTQTVSVVISQDTGAAQTGNIDIDGGSIYAIPVNQAGAAPLSISCVPAAGPTTLALAYSTTCTAAGGSPPYNFGITAGEPAGLNFTQTSATTAVLSGTPTQAGAYSFSLVDGDTTINQASQQFTGTIAGAAQTITFGPPGNGVYGTAVPLSATASSGLAVTFTSNTLSVCTILTFGGIYAAPAGVGTCSITASQAGNTNYAPAPPVTQTFTISQAPQTITFGALSNVTYGAAPFTISATASSGLAVTFASTTSPVCTVSGNTVTIVAAGTCSITASQAGNADYLAATPTVSQSFTVTQGSPLLTIAYILGVPGIANGTSVPYGSTYDLEAETNSNGAITFVSMTPSVCILGGTTTVQGSGSTPFAATVVVEPGALGTCTVAANVAGAANWVAASGQVSNPVVQGSNQIVISGTASPLTIPATVPTPTLTLDSVAVPAANILFAGLTPTLVGLYQIDLRVPASANNGDLQLVLTQSSGLTASAVLPVHN